MSYWQIPKMWEGGDCWIIGGGSSMPRQFGVPEDIITKVENKELPITAYSEYLKPIHDKNVIGVNLAFLLGPWVSVLYFVDARFFRVYREQINTFHNLKATDAPHIDRELQAAAINIKRLKRDVRYGLSTERDSICWNNNSGCAAINFAVHAGAKRILLLGFDMKPNEAGRTHWHSGNPLYTDPTPKGTFRRFLKAATRVAVEAKERGVEVLNISPNSAIEDFKKVTLKEIL